MRSMSLCCKKLQKAGPAMLGSGDGSQSRLNGGGKLMGDDGGGR